VHLNNPTQNRSQNPLADREEAEKAAKEVVQRPVRNISSAHTKLILETRVSKQNSDLNLTAAIEEDFNATLMAP